MARLVTYSDTCSFTGIKAKQAWGFQQLAFDTASEQLLEDQAPLFS